jgi:hypothetical protein
MTGMIIASRTWTEVLGSWDESCFLRGSEIVRRPNGSRCVVLWRFDSETVARLSFEAWKKGG